MGLQETTTLRADKKKAHLRATEREMVEGLSTTTCFKELPGRVKDRPVSQTVVTIRG